MDGFPDELPVCLLRLCGRPYSRCAVLEQRGRLSQSVRSTRRSSDLNLFGLAPRVAAASFLAFLSGSFLNAYVMSVMKVASGGRRFSLRAVLSSVAGETADSLIFFPIALGGLVPWDNLLLMMFWQILLKTLYEVVILPVTIRVVRWVKRVEGVDVYDKNISYNILKVSQL